MKALSVNGVLAVVEVWRQFSGVGTVHSRNMKLKSM